MSVVKLLGRIVAPDLQKVSASTDGIQSTLHDHTYGITSDPLTQFACVFSAIIHDVDHQGVPNSQLVKENTSQAAVYGGKSVAEQNSVDLAWELLMHDSFADLRRVIYTTQNEFERFRQLVVNSGTPVIVSRGYRSQGELEPNTSWLLLSLLKYWRPTY